MRGRARRRQSSDRNSRPEGSFGAKYVDFCGIISPASASYDQFDDFEDRGDAFRRLVEELA